MPKLKLRYDQTHVATETMEERADLCRWYLALTRTMYELTFPVEDGGFGSNMELLLVLMGVFVGDAEARPTTATKIANHCGLSRQAVYRRLDQLIVMGRVIREGRNYFIAPGTAPLDTDRLLPQVLDKFKTIRRPKRTV